MKDYSGGPNQWLDFSLFAAGDYEKLLETVLPIGYADGLPRLASGKWQVVIGGNVYPLAGRFSMDQCCADLGPETDVRRWDEAVIFGGTTGNPILKPAGGTAGGIAMDAAALAAVVGTIPYEITCNINKRVPRTYVR